MEAFIEKLKAIIDEKHLLKHPFYQMWEKGTLPKEVLAKYAEQYYHLELNFPIFLSAMHANCPEFSVRQAITDNLYDEEHGPKNHRELWLRFGEGVGADRNEIINSTPLPETQAAIDAFRKLSDTGFLEGSGGLGAYESQIPAISVKKVEGLKEHYGITEKRTTEFFDLHGILDIHHAQAWWDIITEFADTDEKKDAVEKAVAVGRDALWGFLDGVCKAYVPEALEMEC